MAFPTILSTIPVEVPTRVPSGRIMASVTEPRAFAIVNRGNNPFYLGDNPSVSFSSGFAMFPGDVLVMATAAEVWITPGVVHVLVLAQ